MESLRHYYTTGAEALVHHQRTTFGISAEGGRVLDSVGAYLRVRYLQALVAEVGPERATAIVSAERPLVEFDLEGRRVR